MDVRRALGLAHRDVGRNSERAAKYAASACYVVGFENRGAKWAVVGSLDFFSGNDF